MHVREIARSEWPSFLDQFSRDHHSELVTVEVLTKGIGLRAMARQLPLLGITVPTQRPTEIIIAVGDSQRDRLTRHIVQEPLHVLTDETGGRDTSLLIDSANGPITLIDLHARPEGSVESSLDRQIRETRSIGSAPKEA